ncbi:MAG: phosphate signaling complex protein PhoU [Methylococcales bacterium]|jgi:phosphate transport system protein|nr:phosphate signaling complex protein PhoU [Methylococcales bacterium]MBT7443641.1 phosphate signaling complex protein PhoU [Methylococcales bacterium]
MLDKDRLTHHISKQFNSELEDIRNRVLTMGGLVEHQVGEAMAALSSADQEKAEIVIRDDFKVNALEVEIDEECNRVLARRQPTASDLRLIVAVIKTITDLERIGDEAEKIARMTLKDVKLDKKHNFQIRHFGEYVQKMVHDALDAFARMDVPQAVATAKADADADNQYDSLMRELITYMMEDPRSISQILNLLWAARALERIGDHARNICEYVIYLVEGKDVRHITLEQIEQAVMQD